MPLTSFCKNSEFEYALRLEVEVMRYFILVVLLLVSAPIVVQCQPGGNQRPLVGTDWRLVSLGPPGAETDVVTGTTVTLRLGEDGRAGGSTGCNTYGGTYEVRG